MTFSNGKIERIAVDAVTNLANKPGSYLIPNIPVGDKEVSFDGKISVFIDDSEKKESLEGIVPAQVKGTQVISFHEGVRTFSLDMAHYRNYLKNNGVLLIVCEVNGAGDTKLFYKSLLAMELSGLIKSFGHQKSRTVELRPLNETNLYTVCRKFLSEQQYQPKILVEKKPLPIDSFPKYTFTSLTFNPKHESTKRIFDHDFIVYGVLNEMQFPVNYGRISSLATEGERRFIINGTTFDLNVKITIEEHKTTFIFENIFSLVVDERDKKFHIRFLEFHSLKSQLKTIPFVIQLLSGYTVEFEGGVLALNKDAPQVITELQEICELQGALIELKKVFQSLGIDETTIFQSTDDASLTPVFNFLIRAILHNDIKGLNIEKPENGSLISLNVGNRIVVLFYNPTNEQKLINAFSEEMLKIQCVITEKNGSEPYPLSVYNMLDVTSLAQGININPKIILHSFEQFDPFLHEDAFNHTNNFCLKCISAYDLSEDVALLDLALSIYNKYTGTPDDSNYVISLINQYQIRKRKNGTLTEEERKQLFQYKIMADPTNNVELLFCINVLLENEFEAEMMYEDFKKEQQEFYQILPIFKLYQNL